MPMESGADWSVEDVVSFAFEKFREDILRAFRGDLKVVYTLCVLTIDYTHS